MIITKIVYQHFLNNYPKDDKVLLAILNSKMGWWLISRYCTAIQNGFQLIWNYFGQILIPTSNESQSIKFIEKVDKILTIKKENPQADTSQLEAEIDEMVFDLYELTPEEREIVRGN